MRDGGENNGGHELLPDGVSHSGSGLTDERRNDETHLVAPSSHRRETMTASTFVLNDSILNDDDDNDSDEISDDEHHASGIPIEVSEHRLTTRSEAATRDMDAGVLRNRPQVVTASCNLSSASSPSSSATSSPVDPSVNASTPASLSSPPSSLATSSLFESLSKSFSSAFDVVKSKTRWGAETLLDGSGTIASAHDSHNGSFPNSPVNQKNGGSGGRNASSFLWKRISTQSSNSEFIPKVKVFLHEIRLIQVYQNVLTIYLKNSMMLKLMVLDPVEVNDGSGSTGESPSTSTPPPPPPMLSSPSSSQLTPTHTPRSIALAKKLKSLLKYKIRKEKYVGMSVDLQLNIPSDEEHSHGHRSAITSTSKPLFDTCKEFTRQRVLKQTNDDPADIAQWRVTTVNMNFDVCSSYPQLNVVPFSLSDEEIIKASAQRANGRFPILAWASSKTGVSISRASQPCYGLSFFSGNSLEDDQHVLKCINATNPHSSRLAVIDLRSKLAANANRIKGFGFEIDYADVDLHFMNIGNIHAVRSSFFKVLDLVHSTGGNTPNWLSQLEKSQWLEFVLLLLHTAEFCKNLMVKHKTSCLLHCSDSWDRSSQEISLVMVMMDPYYRTMEGFAVLIQKEWLSPGHLWKTRNLVGFYSPKSSQYSPIFFQFVEALYQLVKKYPDAFEFNEEYLLALSDAIYSGEFVDFLSNTDQERLHLPSSPSFFGHVIHERHKTRFVNPNYKPCEEVLSAQLRYCDIDLWKGWWLRFTDYL